MPNPTFFRLPAERRALLVEAAIAEFSERSYAEASLSQIARSTGIPKGSFYQYFEDKLDLYRWLLCDEAPRQKREFLERHGPEALDFWSELEHVIERGMAFLVEHPRLARITASAADPSAVPEVRDLHKAICEAGIDQLRAVLQRGVAQGALNAALDLELATRLVATVVGPGLTDVVLKELGTELHEVLASDSLRGRLGPKRRTRLAHETVNFLRHGLSTQAAAPRPRTPVRKTTKQKARQAP